MYDRHWLSLFGYFISVASSRGNVILFYLSVGGGVVMAGGMCQTGLLLCGKRCRKILAPIGDES